MSLDFISNPFFLKADSSLQHAFILFVKSVIHSHRCYATEWRLFYSMIAIACKVDYEKRWRVSEFAALISAASLPNCGNFATAYAHGFYSVMVYRGERIYEGGIFI